MHWRCICGLSLQLRLGNRLCSQGHSEMTTSTPTVKPSYYLVWIPMTWAVVNNGYIENTDAPNFMNESFWGNLHIKTERKSQVRFPKATPFPKPTPKRLKLCRLVIRCHKPFISGPPALQVCPLAGPPCLIGAIVSWFAIVNAFNIAKHAIFLEHLGLTAVVSAAQKTTVSHGLLSFSVTSSQLILQWLPNNEQQSLGQVGQVWFLCTRQRLTMGLCSKDVALLQLPAPGVLIFEQSGRHCHFRFCYSINWNQS